MTLDDLLAQLRGIPKLTGCACIGLWKLFDSDAADDVAAATEVCKRCPALAACATWLASLPPRQRPPGVVAGQVQQHKPKHEPRTRPPTMRERCLAAIADHEDAVARTGAEKAVDARTPALRYGTTGEPR
jgi:WhiB family transcriptional regulator, redox-sensing transcriptional regulator